MTWPLTTATVFPPRPLQPVSRRPVTRRVASETTRWGNMGVILACPLEPGNLGLQQPAVEVEPNGANVAVLFRPQQVPRPAELEVLQGDAEPGPQVGELPES